jgi:hypothetical protein
MLAHNFRCFVLFFLLNIIWEKLSLSLFFSFLIKVREHTAGRVVVCAPPTNNPHSESRFLSRFTREKI